MSGERPGSAGVSDEPKALVFAWLDRVYCQDGLGSVNGGKTALQLAGALASAADYPAGTNIRRTVATLAAGTGMSERSVRQGLTFLTDHGYLETVSRGGSRGRGAPGAGTATVRRLRLPESPAETVESEAGIEESPVITLAEIPQLCSPKFPTRWRWSG